jgi:hypothetical protein
MSSSTPFAGTVLSDSRLERFPMFITEMSELFIICGKHNIHKVHPLLQPSNPLLALMLLTIQEGLVMTSLVPNVVRSVVLQKEPNG